SRCPVIPGVHNHPSAGEGSNAAGTPLLGRLVSARCGPEATSASRSASVSSPRSCPQCSTRGRPLVGTSSTTCAPELRKDRRVPPSGRENRSRVTGFLQSWSWWLPWVRLQYLWLQCKTRRTPGICAASTGRSGQRVAAQVPVHGGHDVLAPVRGE